MGKPDAHASLHWYIVALQGKFFEEQEICDAFTTALEAVLGKGSAALCIIQKIGILGSCTSYQYGAGAQNYAEADPQMLSITQASCIL